MPTTIALAETRWLGHHPTFFREFAASLRRIGMYVIALCPRPEELEPADGMFAARLDAPYSGLVTPMENDPASTFARWWITRRVLDRAEETCGRRADIVFFPYLDNYLRFLPVGLVPDVVLGRRWSGLYFRNQHLRGGGRSPGVWVRDMAKGDRILRSRQALPWIGVLDERFDEALVRRFGRHALAFPDITDETDPAERSSRVDDLLARAKGRPIVGLAGSLEKRKGLLTLLRTAEASAAAGDNWYFAALGTFADETFTAEERAWIEQTRHRLAESLFLDMTRKRIPDGAEYNAVVAAFTVAWAAYEDFHGSSNTLTKAALLRRPVLATEGECIGGRVVTHALGATIPERDPVAARAALARLIDEEKVGGGVRGYDGYRRLHSRGYLDAVFQRLVASALPAASQGISPA